MWLGVVLHATIAYKTDPESGWPSDPSAQFSWLNGVYTFIHSFRMPLFFLVAGYFGRMVITRSGRHYFTKQRVDRILIPFIAGIIILVPLTMMPFHYYRYHYLQGISESDAMNRTLIMLFKWDGIAHLWFLYYLLMFYVASLLASYLPSGFRNSFIYFFKPLLLRISLFHILLISLLVFVIIYLGKAEVPPVYTGLKPKAFHFLYYGLFYLAGWILQIEKNSVPSLSRHGIMLTITGFLLMILLSYNVFANGSLPYLLTYSILTVCFTGGITGIFIKFAASGSVRWRYFSDSAYWVYLVHMGVVAFLQLIFLDSSIPPQLRFPLILVLTFIFCMVTYHYLVRFTVIGRYLHGKR